MLEPASAHIYSRLSDVEIEKENDKQTELVLKRSGQGHALA